MRYYAHLNNHSFIPEEMLSNEYLDLAPNDSDKSYEELREQEKLNFERISSDEYYEGQITKNLIIPFFSYLSSDVHEKLKDVVFGILVTREINAFATKAPNDGAIIVLNNRLMKAFHYYAQAIHTTNKEFVADNSLIDIKFKDIAEKIVAYFYNEEMEFPFLTTHLKKEGVVVATLLCTAMEFFVILHEYAHIYLGHLDIDPSTLTYEMKQQRELEADILAFKWIYQVRDACNSGIYLKHVLNMSPLSVEAFFVLGLVEIARMARGEITLEGSHPLILDRLSNIMKKCEDNLSEYDKRSIESTFNTLLYYTKNLLEKNELNWD